MLLLAQENQSRTLAKFLTPSSCLHFLYRGGSGGGSGLSQCFSSKMEFPLDSEEAQGTIWSQYQRLALCLRVGSSSVESTVGAEEEEGGVSVLSSNPAPDHAQSYAVLASGYVVVGITTSESELYATFAESCGGAIEACGLANLLNRSLALESVNLFV